MASADTLCKKLLNVKNTVVESHNFYDDTDGVTHQGSSNRFPHYRTGSVVKLEILIQNDAARSPDRCCHRFRNLQPEYSFTEYPDGTKTT